MSNQKLVSSWWLVVSGESAHYLLMLFGDGIFVALTTVFP